METKRTDNVSPPCRSMIVQLHQINDECIDKIADFKVIIPEV